ncbi:MAG: DNA primase family protein, partial [Enterococcus gilvus]
FINDTIFANPLPEKEMEQLARDIQFTAEKDGEAIIADLIMKEKRVVKFNGMLYFYDDGEYICDVDKLKRMVFGYCEGQKTRYVDEVISQMSYRTKLVPEDQTFDIKFKNGILRSGEFLEIDYTDFTPYSISSDYDPETKPVQVVDDYLNHLTGNDAEYKKVVLEMMAHCLITDKEVKRLLGKFFIMVGDGGNGKGTLLTIVRAIFNTKNCSGLSVKKMTDERYFNVLQGKLCNLGDDIEDEAINNEQMKVLKNISTCDFVEMRKLYRDATSVEMTPTLIFTSNHILKSFEKGESYKRRVVWMPMYGKVKKKDGRFISKLTSEEALKYWIKLIVEAYFELWNREKFSTSKALEEFNRKYHEENNSALEWVEELKTEDIEGRKGPEVYEEYEVWAQENGLNVQSKRQLNTTIKELLKMEPQPRKINGKSARVYMDIK